MGLFSRHDWNVIAIMFERRDLFRVNGNRGRGSTATKIRDGARRHARTLYWAVFDQKRAFLEGEPGPGRNRIPPEMLQKLMRDLPTNRTVQYVLEILEKGELDKAAKPMEWDGYPRSAPTPS